MENLQELLDRLEKLEHEVAEHRAARAELSRHATILERLKHPVETMEKLQSHLDSFEKLDRLGERAKSVGEFGAGLAAAILTRPEASAEAPPHLRAAADEQHSIPVRVAVGDSDVVAVPDGAGGDADGWWSAIRDLASRGRGES